MLAAQAAASLWAAGADAGSSVSERAPRRWSAVARFIKSKSSPSSTKSWSTSLALPQATRRRLRAMASDRRRFVSGAAGSCVSGANASCAEASSTPILRPPMAMPFRVVSTPFTEVPVTVTKAKPRDAPDSRSLAMTTFCTSQDALKHLKISSSVAAKGTLRTNRSNSTRGAPEKRRRPARGLIARIAAVTTAALPAAIIRRRSRAVGPLRPDAFRADRRRRPAAAEDAA
mmetsp:Transcript_34696/g.121000  ORF Transcript_34696/g.121000 Transcript_34696/m.121000 type:complete len:230 (-) Transcript_34696:16-705(-)